jgi:hypothetical protein
VYDLLYDHQLDAVPTGPATSHLVERPQPAAVSKVKPWSIKAPGRFWAWFTGLSFPNVVGVGLAAGFLASIPIVLALTPRRVAPPPAALAPRSLPAPWTPAPAPRPKVGLAAVMDGVRRTISSGDWQRTGRPDPELVKSIAAVLAELRGAAGDPNRMLPVEFGSVSPSIHGPAAEGRSMSLVRAVDFAPGPPPPEQQPRSIPTAVVLRRDRASRSILIADGDVVIREARDSVIVATGSVEATSFSHCVILAGHRIRVGSDAGSVLAAGSRIEVTRSHLSLWDPGPRRAVAIHAAPEDGVEWAVDGTIVAVNVARFEGPGRCIVRRVNRPTLDVTDEARGRGDPLKGNVAFVATSTPDSYHGAVHIRVRGYRGSVRVVGSGPIVDPGGRLLPGLEGWSVVRIEQDYTIVCDGGRLLRVEHWKSQADPFADEPRSPRTKRPPAAGHDVEAGPEEG